MMDGWIKLQRHFADWRWYTDGNTMRLFIHLLITANFETRGYRTTTVYRGQRLASVTKLAAELDLTAKQIRTAVEHLKETGEITVEGTPKHSIYTVVNYDYYQTGGQAEGQAKGQARASTEEQARAKWKTTKNDVSATDTDPEFSTGANKGQTEGKQRANKGQTEGKQTAMLKTAENDVSATDSELTEINNREWLTQKNPEVDRKGQTNIRNKSKEDNIIIYNTMGESNANVETVETVENLEEGKEDGYPTAEEVRQAASAKGRADVAQEFYNYYTKRKWRNKYGARIDNWRISLDAWIKRSKPKKPAIPRSDNAEAYRSFIENLRE